MPNPPAGATFSVQFSRFTSLWPPPAGVGAWVVGTVVFDVVWDLWVCTATGDPGTWKKLSGGGGGAGNYTAEDLSSQVDGVNDTFTTSSARQGGTVRVYRNGQDLGTPGTLAGGAEVEETSATQFKVAVVPAAGEKIHVSYFV